MSKRTQCRGELAKPIRVRVVRPHGFVVPDFKKDPEAKQKARAENDLMGRLRDQARAHAETEKLRLVAEHYGVERNDFRGLALALAHDFIPGFRFVDPLRPLKSLGSQYENHKKNGRPKHWNVDRLVSLAAAVKRLRAREDLTDREALTRIARKREWGPPGNHRGDFRQWVETLESRLQEAKRDQRRIKELEAQIADIAQEIASESDITNSGNPTRDS